MSSYVLLYQTDPEWTGSDTWWRKGDYEAESPEDAIKQAYEGTYLSPNRKGKTTRTDRVAVTGPDTVWREYDVTTRAVLAELVDIVEMPHRPYDPDPED